MFIFFEAVSLCPRTASISLLLRIPLTSDLPASASRAGAAGVFHRIWFMVLGIRLSFLRISQALCQLSYISRPLPHRKTYITF